MAAVTGLRYIKRLITVIIPGQAHSQPAYAIHPKAKRSPLSGGGQSALASTAKKSRCLLECFVSFDAVRWLEASQTH